MQIPCARADPQEIEDGEPVTLEDAFTDPTGQLSLQYSGSYVHRRNHGTADLLQQGPTFKLGVVKGVQVSLNPNYSTGASPDRNQGNLLADVLVQLTGQSRLLPALAFDTFYAVPFGAANPSAAYVFRAIASKSLGAGENAPRLHLNLTDYHLTQPDADNRKDQLQLVFGGSTLLTPRDALVTDIVHGASEHPGQSETLLEIGYSRDLPDDWTLQVGVGRQIAGRATTVELFFAIEKELRIY